MQRIFNYYVAGKCTKDFELSITGLKGCLLQDQFVFGDDNKFYYVGEQKITQELFVQLIGDGKIQDYRSLSPEVFLDVDTLQDYVEELKGRTNLEYWQARGITHEDVDKLIMNYILCIYGMTGRYEMSTSALNVLLLAMATDRNKFPQDGWTIYGLKQFHEIALKRSTETLKNLNEQAGNQDAD